LVRGFGEAAGVADGDEGSQQGRVVEHPIVPSSHWCSGRPWP
jgi:hypothetical protein